MSLENFLSLEVSSFKSLTPKTVPLIQRHVGHRLIDVLFYFPTRIRVFHFVTTLTPALEGKHVIIKGMIISHSVPKQPQRPCQIVCALGAQKVTLTFFQGHHSVYTRLYPIHKEVTLSGLLNWRNQWQIVHPTLLSTINPRSTVQPLYPLTEGINAQRYKAVIGEALTKVPHLQEWIPSAIKSKYNWPSWKEAILGIHHPKSEECLLPQNHFRQRFAFDELLAHSLSIGLLTHHQQKSRSAVACPTNSSFFEAFQEALPFKLTSCQHTACLTISEDVAHTQPMLRLLQGDVGSGKTAVAMYALLLMAQQKFQSVLLSPTEILAQQQFASMQPIAAQLNASCRLLTSSTSKKERKEILSLLEHGELDILIGTHAVLEKDVVFKSLNMVVIDEQHRFGVQQRLSLVEKGFAPHTLIMSATPIPRSLTLTFFGSVGILRLKARPRPFEVQTQVLSIKQADQAYENIEHFVTAKERVFWVCPLITPSEKMPLASATERLEILKERFPNYNIGIVHGKMTPQEKQKVIAEFRAGNLNLLVATTVIEVGVDIPQCSLMIIEDAQFFGLAQLHQLRGRVGRQGQKAKCLLLHAESITETGSKRLATIELEQDGFALAEKDLMLRGAGDILGIKQSGLPPFLVADFAEHTDLNTEAQNLARNIIETNPNLEGLQGENLRTLIRILRNDPLSYLLSG